MSYLEIILPFGIPNTALAKELLRQAQTPSLAKLITFGKLREHQQLNEFARLLPHEFCLYQDPFSEENLGRKIFEAINDNERLNSPATTHYAMSLKTEAPKLGFWFTLNPVHIHIARDHLVMTDPQRLEMTERESRDLFKIAHDICTELGHELVFGDSKTWFLRADEWQELRTSSLSAATGHNMDIWIAEGEQSRAWRKLQNEIQMAWHISGVNQNREEQGKSAINSVWLHSGSGELQRPNFRSDLSKLQEALDNTATSTLPQRIFIDTLIEPALNSDWGHWLMQLNQLESTCFSLLWSALESGRLKRLHLVLSDTQQLAYIECRRQSFWQRWQATTLAPLLKLTPMPK